MAKHEFPDNCAHRTFFKCKNARQCIGCYYNPIKEQAFTLLEGEESIDKPDYLWFYSDPVFAKTMLKDLARIKSGDGKYVNTGVSFKKPKQNKEILFS